MSTPYELHEDLIAIVKKTKTNFIEQGRCLYLLRKNSMYREAIGDGGSDSWHEYLSQPEIGMSPTQANKLLHIYELFIKKLNYSEKEIIQIPVKTLNYLIKRQAEFERLGKDKQDEIIEQGKVLSFKDFKEAYFDQKSEESNEVRTYEYIIMRKCHQTGNMTKVHEYGSDDIKIMMNNYQKTSYDRP